ncbi:DNA repair protein RecO [Lacrimispora saccharolytica]|uniref:DNA repair protein RecO n=1 Tax=Lacrimispora saccharolytica (strain ATCC 35040 / DSM 2544 / NRCC 2533 / WM1) TaxID=610130 RepID=D9R690_LACSW|nr:DNA repair protein RecO [Lacrimispora saccharolytica]ADL03524.1 DNA repair protein RecO [[Clostridium] saccharolyticum WM1]QRV18326.1 DNA repair protein RecO [Lacrimispora saccharolytica]
MREVETMTGMVIRVSPVGEMDKRLVILTRERGKITAFARGSRRPGSPLMAVSRPFAFGQFSLYEGRDSYTLRSAEIINYFDALSLDMEGTCYGSYFLELADYYARENMDGTGLLKLLYQSIRALLKPALKNQLVQRVFELKAMVLNGEYTEKPPCPVSDSAGYTWEYVIASPAEHLYTFTLTEPVLEEFSRCVEINKKRYVDRDFHSLEILQTMTGGKVLK